MDTLLDLAAFVLLIAVPILLGLIYLELRQRRMFGPRSIIETGSSREDTAAIAMSLQAELERLRSDVHGVLANVSSDIGQVRDQLASRETVSIAPPPASSAAGEPRIDFDRAAAIAELYSALSKLDVAFLAVARPVLLPGEVFELEDELPAEALRWENWSNVGAAAYAFAEAFSERRIRLEPTTRDQLNVAIGSIRRCLTARLYPLLNDLDGSIGDEHRLAVADVVGSLASDIREARAVLEQVPTTGHPVRAID